MKTSLYLLIFLMATVSLKSAELADYLIPIPKILELREGTLNRNSGRIIIPEISDNQPLIGIADTLQSLLSQLEIETTIAARAAKGENPLLWMYLRPEFASQEYRITILTNQILLEGGGAAGLFYALQTFKQIVRYAKEQGALPLVFIQDSPEFERRGILLDVSRNKVPTMETLKNLVDLFASWKINELQLYTENTFAYQNHSVVWEGFSPMTASEILELDKYCSERFIDLVPNQTSFAHMNQWFEHDQYKDLAEVPGTWTRINLSPAVPGSMNLMRELYSELLPNFSSKYFNINCDETDALGTGRTKELVEEIGKGRVYLDFLLQLKNEVDKHGRTTQFWGDIIIKHPELIPELPKDMIALVWGYSADYPFDINCKKFREAGSPFYVCPGTSSWNSLVGRNQTAFDNLKNAAMNGIKHGAMGYLNTDWGDYGHWQPLSVSYPTYLYGAAVSWGFESNQNIGVGKLVSRYIFNDPTNKSGQALIDIGNAYMKTAPGKNVSASLFNHLLRKSTNVMPTGTTKEGLQDAIEYLDNNLQLLVNAPMASDEEKIIKAEMTLAVNMAKLGCKIGLARFSNSTLEPKEVPASKRKALASEFETLIEEYKKLWIVRNRPGGLHISAGNLERAMMELH